MSWNVKKNFEIGFLKLFENAKPKGNIVKTDLRQFRLIFELVFTRKKGKRNQIIFD